MSRFLTHKPLLLAGLLVLLLAVPLTLWQINTQKDSRSRADVTNPVNFVFSTPFGETKVDQTFEVPILLQAGTHNITGVTTVITFDTTKLQYVDYVTPQEFQTAKKEHTSGTVTYTGIRTNSATVINGNVAIGSIKLKALTSGTTTLTINQTTSQVVAAGSSGADLLQKTTPITTQITLSPATGPTLPPLDSVFFNFSPSTSSPMMGRTFDVPVTLDAKNYSVTGVNMYVSYDTAKLRFTGFDKSPLWSEVITEHTNGIVHYMGVNIAGTGTTGALHPIGTLKFEPVAVGSTTLNLRQNSSQVTAFNTQGRNILDTTHITSANLTVIPVVTPTIDPNATQISLTVGLNALGRTGDSTSPNLTGNLTPQTTTRDLTLEILGTTGQLVNKTTFPDALSYNATSGKYTGLVGVILPDGDYSFKISSPTYLKKQFPATGTFRLSRETRPNVIPALSLVTGDSNGDNKLDINDYQIFYECYDGVRGRRNCTADAKHKTADFNDDGTVDLKDYNIFVREISVEAGD